AGTSTNGTGAFGATVNMVSEKPSLTPHIDAEGTMGSYNTYNGTIKAGSGLLFNHLVLDGRFSVTNSDGYIDRTKSHLGSYFTSASWYGNDYLIKLKNFGSFEHTGQAWNGVPSDSIEAGKRTYNSLGVFYDHKDRIHFRPTTDNYLQNHTHLSFIKNINDLWDAQATLFYTYGIGYYEDMKDNSNLAKKFGLNNYAGIEGDANRQKWLKNNSLGGIFNVTRKSDRLDLTMGGGFQYFDGDHWGEFESIINSADSSKINIGNAHYYDSNAKKNDANIYLKGVYHIGDNLHLFADAQYRYVNYLISGNNDVFIKDGNGKYHNQLLNIDETFHFFNPKAGISYSADWGNSYFSVTKIEREPTRNNYTDNGGSLMPKAETLYDYELGYRYKGDNWFAGFNLYYMDYKNQLIATGQLSDIGEVLTENVKDSYRRGIEIEAGATLFDHIVWNGNATFSQNKIVNFTEYVDNWDGNPLQIHYDETDIALSPGITAYSRLSASFLKGFNASITTNYVG
ncbi:MAG: TonB-dependent receptor, partial [Bacteroidaceae bacterium]|nr:TonB-dependent receptor [Bacteroidaceae bacterium]